jgi:hypothetical protein
MLRRVALVRTEVSEELSASFIRVTRIRELRITLAVTMNRRTLRRLLIKQNQYYHNLQILETVELNSVLCKICGFH